MNRTDPAAAERRTRLRRWISWMASAAVFGVCIWILDWGRILAALRTLDLSVVAVVVVLLLVKYALMAWRWSLIASLASERLVPGAARDALIANLWNLLTPANFGGDGFRLAHLRVAQVPMADALAGLASERLLGLLGYLSAYCVCWLSWQSVEPQAARSMPFPGMAAACALALAGVAASVWWLGRGRTLPSFVPRACSAALTPVLAFAVKTARLHRLRGMALPVLITASVIALWIAIVWILARKLGVALPPATVGAIAIIAELLRLVPLSIQGIGIREGAFAGLLAIIGQSPAAGFAIAAVAYALLTVSMVVAGLAGLAWPVAKHRPGEPTSPPR
jgi:uncharacterized membrane protein YbhN (UPF0104 family)